ncbi:hypothetical protein [Rubellimicrobium sp. CFH 75288]|uniref:hypothetical protein n=1 Tax=Rubellimicrobium sp. CFH 75288 TaxID=2697034 RepID=UPI0014134C81|nr:hypothetical protein [Rubellimicrobium sp. CFH 75288]NAZ35620.1 hypothetical protein [Rubellimicrobium sp. CFH 75288]
MDWKRVWVFGRDEDGAVTVDWVVLTAAILLFGVLVVSMILSGATDLSGGAGARLGAAEVPAVRWE